MTRTPFGTTHDGRRVEKITLNSGTLQASVLTLGATLQDLRLASVGRSLTLGSDSVADYEGGGALEYFGCIAGPVANRIRDARAPFDGRELAFEANALGGHTLHGGAAGLHHKLWTVEEVSDTRLLLSATSAAGEGGYPGNRRWQAEFAVEGAALTLTLRAETDAPTLVNLCNHSYWNLGDSADFHGHFLQINADSYLPADETALATGERRSVEGTPFDFRAARALTLSDVLDNNFCLSDARTMLRPVASLAAPNGLLMEIATTEPGLQIYDARHLPAAGVPGHDGRRYGPRAGLAIEAQVWPDAPNHPEFPSVRLEPGDAWEQVTRFTFSRA